MPPQKPKPREMVVDVVVAKDETLAPSDKCLLCEARFEPEDVILRMRDFRLLLDYFFHRRCIVHKLDHGPVDDAEFEAYRRKILGKR